MMDSLKLLEDWKKFKLTSETTVDMNGLAAIITNRRLETSLIGKLLSKRVISGEFVSKFLKSVWKIESGFTI